MSAESFYSRIKKDHKASFDWRTPASILLCAVLLLGISASIFFLGRIQYRFNRFCDKLFICTEYSAEYGSFMVDDGTGPKRSPKASDLRRIIYEGFTGVELKEVPEEDPLVTCIYGNGCVLKIWEAMVDDRSMGHGNEPKLGTLISFTNGEDYTYIYKTKRISAASLRDFLTGASMTYTPPAEVLFQ